MTVQKQSTMKDADQEPQPTAESQRLPLLKNNSVFESSVKRRLKEHIIIQNMYHQSPNYTALAKEITEHKKKKSAIGLIDSHKLQH